MLIILICFLRFRIDSWRRTMLVLILRICFKVFWQQSHKGSCRSQVPFLNASNPMPNFYCRKQMV